GAFTKSTTIISLVLDHASWMGSKRWPEHYIRKPANNDDAGHIPAHPDRLQRADARARRCNRRDVVARQRTTAGARFVVCDLFRRHVAVRSLARSIRHSVSASFATDFVGGSGRWLARDRRRELPGLAAQSARGAVSAWRFQRCGGRNDGRACLLWHARMEPPGARLWRRFDRDTRGLSTRARPRGHDARTFDTRRSDRHDLSFVGDRFRHHLDGRDANKVVQLLAARLPLRPDAHTAA